MGRDGGWVNKIELAATQIIERVLSGLLDGFPKVNTHPDRGSPTAPVSGIRRGVTPPRFADPDVADGLAITGSVVELRIFVDGETLEVFFNGGRVNIAWNGGGGDLAFAGVYAS